MPDNSGLGILPFPLRADGEASGYPEGGMKMVDCSQTRCRSHRFALLEAAEAEMKNQPSSRLEGSHRIALLEAQPVMRSGRQGSYRQLSRKCQSYRLACNAGAR